MKRFVLYSEQWGIYLGEFLGFGFWTKIDGAGQDAAITFADKEEALRCVESWLSKPGDFEIKSVECADQRYVTIDECEAAGLPRWEP